MDIDGIVTAYHRDGYAVAEGIVSAAQCQGLIAAAQALPSAREGGVRTELNIHRLAPIFEQAMAHSAILAVIDRLVGDTASGLQSQFFHTPPGAPGLHAHQDNRYVETDVACFASAWLALVDVSPANGGLYAYPGTHLAGSLPVRTAEGPEIDTRAGVRELTVVPDGYDRHDVVAGRGSVVFIHGHVVHGSHPNRSTRWRYALLNTYLRPGVPFRAGRTGGRQEHPLPRLQPAA